MSQSQCLPLEVVFTEFFVLGDFMCCWASLTNSPMVFRRSWLPILAFFSAIEFWLRSFSAAFIEFDIPHKGVLNFSFVWLSGCCPPVRRCQASLSPINRLLLNCSRHTTCTSNHFAGLLPMGSKSLRLVRVFAGKDFWVCMRPCLITTAALSRCFYRFRIDNDVLTTHGCSFLLGIMVKTYFQ